MCCGICCRSFCCGNSCRGSCVQRGPCGRDCLCLERIGQPGTGCQPAGWGCRTHLLLTDHKHGHQAHRLFKQAMILTGHFPTESRGLATRAAQDLNARASCGPKKVAWAALNTKAAGASAQACLRLPEKQSGTRFLARRHKLCWAAVFRNRHFLVPGFMPTELPSRVDRPRLLYGGAHPGT